VLRLVQRRAEQVGHGRIHYDEVSLAAPLDVEHLRQQDARIGCYLPARLENDVQAGAFQQRCDPAGVIRRQRRATRFVVGTEAAADVQRADLKALAAQRVDKRQRPGDGLDVWFGRVDRRTNVQVDGVQAGV